MSDHLERETQIASAPETSPEAAIGAQGIHGELLDFSSEEGMEFSPELTALVQRCLTGAEPLEPSTKKLYQQEKFSTRHVNMVMLRVAGFKVKDIADALGCNIATVSVALNHPYGKKLLAALMTARGVKVLDIKTKLDVYADQILDQMFELAGKSDDLDKVSKVGFGLLDRAGYGATQKVQHSVPQAGLGTNDALNRLANALEGSQVVDAHIMPTYTPKPPPESQSVSDVGASDSGRDTADARSDVGSGFSGGLRLARVSNE